ncbi:hypothetical protein ANO14919_079270 [Xylariales sp. No.14919]|nr:hypothetical protein ANO14919_079270 [Xylariales sp. No.14919]
MSELPSSELDGQQRSRATYKDDTIKAPSNASQLRTPSQSPPDCGVSSRLAEPEFQSPDNRSDVRRTRKHPATFQCTLCPKTFTRAYNLRSHLRTHTDERPFVCSVCGKAFARQHDRKRHEALHSGGNKFICRGELSNGRSWGCGRRFAGVDALGRHFRSEAGRICLKPLWDDDISQRNQEGMVQEYLADLGLYQPGGEKFTLPPSLLAQYPALARINWQEGVPAGREDRLSGHSSIDSSDYMSSYDQDSGYVSDPAVDYTMLSCDTLLPLANYFPLMLDDDSAKEFATRFARGLAYRSGAHAWSESVLARLGGPDLISRLVHLLTTPHPLDSSEMPHLTPYTSGKKVIDRTIYDICFRFYAEMKSNCSSPKVSSANVKATGPLAEQNEAGPTESAGATSSVDEGHDFHELGNSLRIADKFIFDPSFESLSLLVRENLYSAPRRCMDHVEAVLRVAHTQNFSNDHLRSATLATSPSKSIEFSVETRLTLFDYIKQNFSNQRVELSTLVTITGTAFYSYATTCLDYLERTWPNTGNILLPILQELIREVLDQPDLPAGIIKEHGQLPAVYAQLSSDETLKIRVKGSEAFVVDMMQQLLWLTATFSTPPPGEEGVCYCAPTIQPIDTPTLTGPIFRLETRFEKLHASEQKSCWLSLFSNAVIAHGFPIPGRADGMGLEMSVELMAALIGARHAATFDGGIVIKGFSSIFVPVMRTRDGIQWHYVANSDPDMQLSYEEGVSQCSNRLLLPDLDFASLETSRCFIGWNSLVEIRLGDETNDFENIEFSDAAEVKAALQIPGASLGFQQFGLAQIDVTFGKRDGKCHFQRNSSYRRIVSASERMFVALFDTGERRSCLVPASGLLLHILRHRVSSGLGGVPPSKVRIPSAASSTETLLKNAKLLLTSKEEEPLFVEDVVSEIWSILELLQAQSISAEKNSKLEIHATWQERLLGYEYRAVVEDWSPMPLKELEIYKTCGGWPKLVRDINALVLLANGFGDLIRPIDNQTSLCHQLKTLPRGMDYMAVPVKVLLGLYSLAGCRESKKRLTATNLQLHGRGTSPFQPCPTPKERQCSCDRLQQVVSNSSFGQICVTELIEDNGAVIIGESGSLLKRLTKRSAPKLNGILGNAKTISYGEISASWNSDTSSSSIGSESSDSRHSNTSSPASSIDDDREVPPKNLDTMRTGLFKFCHRGKRSLSEMADSISTLSSSPATHSPRPVKQPCLGKSLYRENLVADNPRS